MVRVILVYLLLAETNVVFLNPVKFNIKILTCIEDKDIVDYSFFTITFPTSEYYQKLTELGARLTIAGTRWLSLNLHSR